MTGHKGYASFKHKPWLHAPCQFLKIVIPSVPAELPHPEAAAKRRPSLICCRGMVQACCHLECSPSDWCNCIRTPHPKFYENVPPLFIQKGLRRIVKSPCPPFQAAGISAIFPEIIVQAENRTLMHILILCSLAYALRAADQTELSVQAEQPGIPTYSQRFCPCDSIKILIFKSIDRYRRTILINIPCPQYHNKTPLLYTIQGPMWQFKCHPIIP